jgi:gamma-glutamylcyclotransferase (GGCT)/AIG2-like uncharacterized protein YtfP
MMGSQDVVGVFVYGTLKRGQCREHCWPTPPRKIAAAWTLGRLYTRADYPALISGCDRVLGELWLYNANELPQVLRTLDEVEQTNQPGLEDLYRRVVVDVFSTTDESLGKAFTYHYAMDLDADGFSKIEAIGTDFVQWPGSSAI